ncbi:MAG: CopG family transcriptional regulator, partial [Angustibacter sp.]
MAMTIRPDAHMQRALDDLAESSSQSRNDIIRSAVLEKWEREQHKARVAASAERMRARWGDVLD